MSDTLPPPEPVAIIVEEHRVVSVGFSSVQFHPGQVLTDPALIALAVEHGVPTFKRHGKRRTQYEF